jgi:hemerythrin
MVEYIYYSGVGAKKSQKHTVKEFVNIMNKHFNIECSNYIHELNYKPCIEYKEMNNKIMKKYNKTFSEYNKNKNNKTVKKYKKLVNKCLFSKNVKKPKCNLDEYIHFSGAERKA